MTPLDQALLDAAQRGDLEKVKQCLAQGANPTCYDDRGYTPLHLAARQGHHDIALALLERGADSNVRDYFRYTPLHMAARYGHRDVVRILLQHGANPNLPAWMNRTPLHEAIRAGHSEIALILAQHGATNNHEDQYGHTPFQFALRMRREDIADALLQRGHITLNAVTSSGQTLLHWLSGQGYHRFVLLMLQYGVNPDIRDRRWETPLHHVFRIARLTNPPILAALALTLANHYKTHKNLRGSTPLRYLMSPQRIRFLPILLHPYAPPVKIPKRLLLEIKLTKTIQQARKAPSRSA